MLQKQEEVAPNPGPLYLHDEQDMSAERRRGEPHQCMARTVGQTGGAAT